MTRAQLTCGLAVLAALGLLAGCGYSPEDPRPAPQIQDTGSIQFKVDGVPYTFRHNAHGYGNTLQAINNPIALHTIVITTHLSGSGSDAYASLVLAPTWPGNNFQYTQMYCAVTITSYDSFSGGRIKGVFSGKLKLDSGPDAPYGVSPTVTDGAFDVLGN